MSSEIRDINLAESGEKKIEWVKRNCDLLRTLEKEFFESKPFAGKKVTLSVHLEAKTAYLCLVLAAGGAEMYVTGSNPLSTQDDVAAALNLSLESDDYDSIAGHLINLLEHFPEVGETAEDDFAVYTVLEVDGNRIDKLRLVLKPRDEEDSEEEDGE